MRLTRDVAIKKAKEHFFCLTAYSGLPHVSLSASDIAKAGSSSYIPAQQNTLGRWNKTPWLTPGCTMGASLNHIRVAPLNIKFIIYCCCYCCSMHISMYGRHLKGRGFQAPEETHRRMRYSCRHSSPPFSPACSLTPKFPSLSLLNACHTGYM